MKTILQLTTLAIVLLTFALNSTARAQNDPKAKTAKTTTTQHGPNFVDEDGDGICDNAGTGVGKQNRKGGKGQGQGTGTCTGTGTGDHQRLRLRDGSCGNTAVTGSSTGTNPRRGGAVKK